ncbi:MAG: HAD hydrolase family protein [Pirellulales bacterium]|nr:HAD hydrolase family protein [Pirellulales bacterium]
MVDRPQVVLGIVEDCYASTGLPRENVWQLGGHPLIAFGVASAMAAKSIDRVIVSTANKRVAESACAYGAEAPFLLPAELATNTTPDLLRFQHMLSWLQDHEGYQPSIVVQIRTTTPFRPRGFLDSAIALLQADAKTDSVLAVAHPKQAPSAMWTRDEKDYLRPLLERGRAEPDSQPGPLALWQSGHADVVRTNTILKKGSLTGDYVKSVFVDPSFVVNIDRSEDLHCAETLLGTCALNIDLPERSNPQSVPLPARTRLVVLDFDGTLTDDRVWVDSEGRESVACSRSDGLGLEMLRKAGIEACVLSKEANPVVARRCEKLRIACTQGIDDKVGALREIMAKRDIEAREVVYVGNDVIDIDCMRLVGFSFAPADAHPSVKQQTDCILSRAGGRGAVREVCEILLANLQLQSE